MKQREATTRSKQKGKRLLALDAARGLAVIGMYIQHFALNRYNANIVSGNTMILFILCSGISYSIMSRNAADKGIEEKTFRTRILARSVFIDFLGYLLIMLNGPFAVVLTAYAVLFVMGLLLKNCSDKILMIASGISFIASPVIMIMGMSIFSGSAMLQDIAGGPLSAVALLPVFTAGMLIGRKDLRNFKRQIGYVGAGIFMVVVIKLLSAYVLPHLSEKVMNIMMKTQNYSEINEYAPFPQNVYPISWHLICVAAPQNGSTFTLILGMGVSLIVLGGMCLIERKIPVVLKPFSLAGQIALTLYAIQIILGWLLALLGAEYDFIGSMFLGDIMVAVLTIVLGVILVRWKDVLIEGIMRRFERLFS